jgi:hypothetical protein
VNVQSVSLAAVEARLLVMQKSCSQLDACTAADGLSILMAPNTDSSLVIDRSRLH